jgi:hypothetical protein
MERATATPTRGFGLTARGIRDARGAEGKPPRPEAARLGPRPYASRSAAVLLLERFARAPLVRAAQQRPGAGGVYLTLMVYAVSGLVEL